MDQKKVFQQIIQFQKATFDNSFAGLTRLQEQGETMVDTFLARSSWLPEEGRKAVADWMTAYGKARADFKETVDANFDKIMDFFENAETDVE